MSIKCYQCSSDEDGKGEDNCGAYEYFDQNKNIAVDCMGEEAITPGLNHYYWYQCIVIWEQFKYLMSSQITIHLEFIQSHKC